MFWVPSFILASQTQQVLYVSDPTNKQWSIILLTNKKILNNIDDQEYEDIDDEDDPFLGHHCRMRADQPQLMIYIYDMIMMRGFG
ncbi:hypothetical protein Lal_00033304 [Lupinus albus]|nr:hypothetical protein Lal_00033304 [Lupinus albus]